MRRASWIRCTALLGVFALLAPYTSAIAQDALSFREVLSGSKLPLSVKPKDMPEDFKAVRIKVAGSGGGGLMDMMGALMSPFTMMMGGTSNNDSEGAVLMTLSEVNWTKGDVVTVQGKEYLVTYKWNLDVGQLMAPSKETDAGAAKAEVIKNMELSLSLLALDGITSISPVTGFSKEELVKLIERPYVKPAVAEEAFDTMATAPAAEEPVGTADQTQSVSNAKQVGLGLMIYVTDYDDVFPYAQSTKAVQYVTYPYVKNIDIWKSFNPNKSEFLYNRAVGGVNASAIESPAETILFYESKAWPDGKRIVVFVDSHVALLDAERWSHVEPTLRLKLYKSTKPLPLNYGLDWTPGK